MLALLSAQHHCQLKPACILLHFCPRPVVSKQVICIKQTCFKIYFFAQFNLLYLTLPAYSPRFSTALTWSILMDFFLRRKVQRKNVYSGFGQKYSMGSNIYKLCHQNQCLTDVLALCRGESCL